MDVAIKLAKLDVMTKEQIKDIMREVSPCQGGFSILPYLYHKKMGYGIPTYLSYRIPQARLMRDFNHPNVVRLYGVAATQEPLMLVMELVRTTVECDLPYSYRTPGVERRPRFVPTEERVHAGQEDGNVPAGIR